MLLLLTVRFQQTAELSIIEIPNIDFDERELTYDSRPCDAQVYVMA